MAPYVSMTGHVDRTAVSQPGAAPAAGVASLVTTCQKLLLLYSFPKARMGADAAIAPCTDAGYFIRSHAASIPP